jgi:hypothetical protein
VFAGFYFNMCILRSMVFGFYLIGAADAIFYDSFAKGSSCTGTAAIAKVKVGNLWN